MSFSFNDIQNGKWYKIRLHLSGPVRVYKMEHNGNYYIKTITSNNQMTIIKIQDTTEKIFDETEPVAEDVGYLTDEEDMLDDDDVPVEDLDQISYIIYGNFDQILTYPDQDDWNEILANFDAIEKPKGGKKKTTRRKQKKTTRRNQKKTTRRKQKKTGRRKQKKTGRRKP